MANEKLKELVKQSRDNVSKENIGVDAPVNYRFGTSQYYKENGNVTVGLFEADENGEQVDGLGRSIYSDETLNAREGFADIISEQIRLNKRSS